MENKELQRLKALKNIFPEESWPWSVPAIKRTPQIWDHLAAEDYSQLLEKAIGADPIQWTPGRIAATLSLNDELQWPLQTFEDLPAEVKQKIQQVYQESEDIPEIKKNLEEAFWVALALLGEKSSGKNWDEILKQYLSSTKWDLPLVILYGLENEPESFLRELEPDLALQVLLSNPIEPDQLTDLLVKIIESQEINSLESWLKSVQKEVPELTQKIAKILRDKLVFDSNSIQDILNLSILNQYAGNSETALELLEIASERNRKLQGKLSTNLNKVITNLDDPQTNDRGWNELKSSLSKEKDLGENIEDVASIISSLLEKGHLAAAGDLISKLPDPLPDHPELLSVMADYSRIQNQPIRAEQLALDALEKSHLTQSPTEGLSSILFRLGMYEESVQAAKIYLEKYPNHLKSHLDLVESFRKLGNYSEAAKATLFAAVLYPQDIQLQRKLAGYLEEAASWKDALEIWSKILTKKQVDINSEEDIENHLPLEDLKSFANCALMAQHPNRAISACNQILAQSPENSTAFSMKGKSLCYLGQYEDGLAHLQRAVELSPDLEETWINLADCHLQAGSTGQALQKLKTGLTSSTKKARILYEIGSLETNQGNHSKALESYQQAASAAEMEEVDQRTAYEIKLGEGISYYELGHHDQAQEILKKINDQLPGNSKANYIYGKLLLQGGKPESSLPYFVQAVDKKPTQAEPYLCYADALLQSGVNLEGALTALDKALAIDPKNEIAVVLLGEAKNASGNHRNALDLFQKSRESSLIADPTWSPRISLGLGKTALELGELETAVASLQDGHDRYPQDLFLIKALAQAYQKSDLTSNALEVARKAADVSPQDSDNLSWVAGFTLELGFPDEGISVLRKLIQLKPKEITPHKLLGKAQAKAGDSFGAIETLSTIKNLEEVTPEDLYDVSEILIELGDHKSALQNLNKAINICTVNSEPTPLLPKLWAIQATAYEMEGDPKRALELLDQAITADLDQPRWRIQKADLLIHQDRYQAAIASLNNALDLTPDEPSLHMKLAKVHCQIAGYEEALHHAQEALAGYESQTEHSINTNTALAFAADLASATLRVNLKNKLLSVLKVEEEKHQSSSPAVEFHSYCLAAESALDLNQEVKAADISNFLVSNEIDHPRVKVLQARIVNRQGNPVEGLELYQSAAKTWHETDPAQKEFGTAVELALAKTAQELHIWKEAAVHYQHAAEISPKEKRTLFELAQFYIHRAEARRLTDALKVLNRAPSINSTSSDVYQTFLGCVKRLAHLDTNDDILNRLQIRGEAVFNPSQETADKLKQITNSTEELAALISSYRACRQMVFAREVALDNLNRLGEDPHLDIQINFALLRSKPDTAFKAASSALDHARKINHPQVPLYFVGLALAAQRIKDDDTAEDSMMRALQYWDDEPHWYALAAEITPDYSRSLAYYQEAINLDPEYNPYYIALGKRHLQANQAIQALKAFEKAISLNPDHVDGWIQRALAKRSLHKMPEALASINQAISLAPEHKEAQKTAALLTFENGSYRESERHLVSLLGQEPHDTELLALFARTLTAQKQYEQAFKVMDKAIELEGNALDLELQKASMIKQVEGPFAAIDELRIISSHHPGKFPLIIDLVATLAEAGELEQAIRTAQEVLVDENTTYSPEEKAHLYLTTGRLLRKSGQLDQAVHHLHKAKTLVEPNFQAVLELGRVHHDRRQYEQAIGMIEKAIEIEPGEADGYYQAGRVLKDLKRYQDAEKMLRRASKLAPNDLKVHRQLGVLVTLNLVHGDHQKQAVL
jgi:tetratricopeptide (TPR) repeat protein